MNEIIDLGEIRNLRKKQIESKQPGYCFRMELNSEYDYLCYCIKKRKKLIRKCLGKIVLLIGRNWKYINFLSTEEMCIVLNCLKLARSENISEILGYNVQEYNKLDEMYINRCKKL